MRILFVNQFFWPDPAATAQLLADVCESAVGAGHEVHVVCSRRAYVGSVASRLSRRDRHQGVFIHRVGGTGFGRRRLLGRLLDYLSFYLFAFWRMLRAPRPDVVVTLTTPPLIGVAGALVGRLRRVPHVCWVMDVYPDLAVRLGVLRAGGLLARGLGWVSRRVLRGARGVLVLGRDMAETVVSRGALASRVSLCPNWADGAAIGRRPSSSSRIRVEAGLGPGCCVVGYAGNFGRGHRFEAVLEVVRRLGGDARFGFLFTGGGASFEGVRAVVVREGLGRVFFCGYRARGELGDLLASSDVHLVTQDPKVDGLLVPSKVYGVLAAGRPVVFVGSSRCEVGRLVREGGCGAVVSPGDADALERVLRSLADDEGLRARWGRAARAWFEGRFDRRTGVTRVLRAIEVVVAVHGRVGVRAGLSSSPVGVVDG